MKYRKQSRTLPTWTTRSVTCVRHLQQEASNCNDRFRSTLQSASDRYQRAGRMRKLWRNHAAQRRILRELPAAAGIGNCWRRVEGGLSKGTRRSGRAAQALAARKL